MAAIANFNVLAFASGTTGMIVTAVLITVLMAIVGGIGWYVKKDFIKRFFRKYPVKILIFEKRGNTIVPTALDNGAAVDAGGGKTKYVLKKRGDQIQAPEFDALTANNWLFLFSPTRGEYHPMLMQPIAGKAIQEVVVLDKDGNPKTDKEGRILTETKEVEIPIAQLQPILTESMKYVYADTVKSNYQRFYEPDFMQKYMPLMIILAVSVGIMLILWAALGQMQPFAAAFSAAAHNCGGVLTAAHATPLPPPA